MTEYVVECECGFSGTYDSHPSASAAQAGHGASCQGPRTRIDVSDDPQWDPETAELRDGQAPDDDSHASVNEAIKRELRALQEGEQ